MQLERQHKPAGRVSVRMIHARPQGIMRGLATVAHKMMNEKVKNLRHLCKDSSEVIGILNSTAVPDEAVLMKLDTEQFYLSGSHEDLIELAAGKFEDRQQRNLVQGILWTVLGYQMAINGNDGSLYRVHEGLGMGGVHSGSPSALDFAVKVKRSLLLMEGMEVYVRFRDDVLAALKDRNVAEITQRRFVKKARPV